MLAFAAAVWLFLSWKHDQPKVAVGRRRGAGEQNAEAPGTQVPPLRAGDGSEFITDYTKKLQKALADDGKGLDEIQGGPMLDRTKAEVLVAKAEKKKLGTV
ncbi:hypothetical protein, partial [Brevibacterium paucivorans]|uniref:hypothetical protein n=1 Tax=Brevibacterium paucivorans TaxID=170994 RepID=UPI0011AF9274